MTAILPTFPCFSWPWQFLNIRMVGYEYIMSLILGLSDVFFLVRLGWKFFRKNITEVKCSSHSIARIQLSTWLILDDGHKNLLNTKSKSTAASYFGEKQQFHVDSHIVPSRFSIWIVFSGVNAMCAWVHTCVCDLYAQKINISNIFLALKRSGAFISAWYLIPDSNLAVCQLS